MTEQDVIGRTCQICGRVLPSSRSKVCGNAECVKESKRRAKERFDKRIRESRNIDPASLIVCAVCGKSFMYLSPGHLHGHGLTLAQYKQLYPEISTITSELRDNRSYNLSQRAKHLTYGGKEPDEKLYEFLVGALLGDGSLEQRKMNARYAEGGSNEAYLSWKCDFLKQYFSCTWNERDSVPHTISTKSYRGWWLRTATHPLLTQWHAQWYQPHKVVARELLECYLTSFALAVWFCDDGSVADHSATLSTMGFTMDENQWLSDLL